MKRLFALALLGLVVFVGCNSTEDTTAPATDAGATAPATDATAPATTPAE